MLLLNHCGEEIKKLCEKQIEFPPLSYLWWPIAANKKNKEIKIKIIKKNKQIENKKNEKTKKTLFRKEPSKIIMAHE